MKNLSLILLGLVLTSPLFSQWTHLSEEGYSSDAWSAVLKFQPNSNDPYVMFQDHDPFGFTDIMMRRFDGSEWVDVGGGPMDQMDLTVGHIDFGFDPFNANVPIAYFHTGNYTATVKQSGESWEPMLGMDVFFIHGDAIFDFDISPAGDPVIAYPDYGCQIPGSSEYGPLSVITHEQEWGYVVAPCQSIRPATAPAMEFNDYDDKLMVFHNGGPDPDMNFNGERWLLDYNVSTTEPLAVVEFITDYTPGKMATNPVNGDTYVYTIEPPELGSEDRVLSLKRWDGNSLETINTDDILIRFAECELRVNPVTGEIFVIYQDSFNAAEGYPFVIKKFNGTNWVDAYDSPDFLNVYGVQDFAFHPVTGDIHIACFSEVQGGGGEYAFLVFTNSPLTSVDEYSSATASIFPNPMTTSATLDLGELKGPATLEIYDISGKLMRSESVNLDAGTLTLPRGDLSGGSYLLRVISEGNAVELPFMVE